MWVVSLAALTTFLILIWSGIISPTKPLPTSAQNTGTDVMERLRAVETKVRILEGQVHSLKTKMARIEQASLPTSGPTPTVPPNVVPAGSVLFVHVERGNVRMGPGTNYGIIGSVQSGQIIEKPLDRKNGWYRFCCVDGDKPGWVAGSLVTVRNQSDITNWERARSKAVEISAESLMRNIHSHKGKHVYYRADVFQSLPDGMLVNIDRTDQHNTTVRLLYNHLPTRILEEDHIEFVAVVQGPYTYQTANRGSITVPLLRVMEVRVLE